MVVVLLLDVFGVLVVVLMCVMSDVLVVDVVVLMFLGSTSITIDAGVLLRLCEVIQLDDIVTLRASVLLGVE